MRTPQNIQLDDSGHVVVHVDVEIKTKQNLKIPGALKQQLY